MLGLRTVSTIAILSALLASGCSGGGAQNASGPSPSASVTAPGERLADAAAILVIVLNDETLPIEGASVGIRELKLEAFTDAAGSARFDNLPPGSYSVDAARIGYEAQGRKVMVGPSEEAMARFVLISSPVLDQYHTTLGPFRQFMTCGLATTGVPLVLATTTGGCNYGASGNYPLETVFGDSNNSIRFQIDQEPLDALVGETWWQPSAAGTSNRLITAFSYVGRGGGHWWCASAGPSPTRFTYSTDEEVGSCANKGGTDEPAEPLKKHTLLVFSNVDFADIRYANPRPADLALGQSFDTVLTLFYGEQPDDEFSAMPG